MLQAALAGENVVRLKGGDFIFGRGGEMDSLRAPASSRWSSTASPPAWRR